MSLDQELDLLTKAALHATTNPAASQANLAVAIELRTRRTEAILDRLKDKRAGLLTPRQEEVLMLLLAGDTIQQISDELFMSMSTVKSHTLEIYQVLGTHNRADTAVAAINLGYVMPAWWTQEHP